jgi:hypothetical protein
MIELVVSDPSFLANLVSMMLGAVPVSRTKFWRSETPPIWPSATIKKLR